jgi:uroporphyrinogen III methyltransferase/synthase
VSYETVPGVTAASAAAAFAEIPLTHAGHASAVALLTGHQPSEARSATLDYAALPRFPGTLVFYMGSESAADWSRALIEAGQPPGTPVAVVYRCSWPEQRTYLGTLENLAELIRRHHIEPPTLIVVGQAAALAPERPWFARRPLFGVRVLLSRPHEQAGPLAHRLAELGAEVLRQPAIRIEPPSDWSRVDAALGRLHTYDWLVFSSVNGVRYLLDRLRETGGDMRRLGTVRLAAIGPATADELRRYHLRADLVPPEYRAEALADRLAGRAAGRRFLLARASRGREVLAERLWRAGGVVDQVVVYRSIDVVEPDPHVAAALAEGRIDWVTVTSSAIARALVAMFGDGLRRARLASISPVTSGVLCELGCPPAVEAREYTTEGLLAAIRSVAAAWSS